MKKILITGSSGQLAKAFIRQFSKNNIEFAAPEEKDFNITDKEKISNVLTQYQPDTLINCAAYNNVECAQQDNSNAYLINKTAVSYLAQEAEKHKIKFVHFGTDYVFDGTKKDLYTELDETNPLNEYGKSKLAGEEEALKYNNSLVCRLSWVIGDGQQNFLYKLSCWAKKNKVIKVSQDEISVPCFTFDIVNCVINALENNLTGLYHLTNSGGKASRCDLAKEYIKQMKYDNEIVPVPMDFFQSKVKRPLATPMSNKKISKQLNIEIPEWKQSLTAYVKMIKNNGY